MKKIVFFDIDGTLLDHNKQLPDMTKQAIDQLKKNGVFVAIATGRAPFMFENLRKELDIDSFISMNGQFVVFENEPIYKNPLPEKSIERLLEFSNEAGHSIVYLDEKAMRATVTNDDKVDISLRSLKFPHPEMDIHYYKNRDIYQALVFSEEKDDELYKSSFPEFRFIRWHKYSTDVLPAKGSKAEGIKLMIEKLGFDLKNVYAFGDGLNDIEMLKTVGTGVAMGNGKDEVKEAADFVTTGVHENGIWNGLKEQGLI